MKIIHLFNNFSPKKKCGAEIGAAALTGGLGFLGSIYSNSKQSDNIDYQLAAQQKENQLNRDWQTQEAEKARQFTAQQVVQQNQFQSDLQAQQQKYNLESMKQQAYYNSPVYQRQQLQAANINPQVYFGQQSSFGGSSAQSGGTPSAPSPASGANVGSVGGLSPVSYQPIGTSIASILGALGSSLRDVAQAKKLGIEADWLPKQIRAQVRNLDKDTNLKSLLYVGQHIHNQIENAKIPYAVKMAEADLYKSLATIDLTSEQTLTEKTKQAVNQSLDRLQNALEKLNSREAEKLGLEMPYYVSLIKAKINESSAAAEEHKASAGLKVSETEAQDMANQVRQYGLDEEKVSTLFKWITEYDLDNAKRSKAIQEWVRIQTMLNAERNSDNLRKINSSLQNLFDLLGLHVSIGAHN